LPQIYNYTIETVYLLVDIKKDKTQTVTTIPNSRRDDDWLSISSVIFSSVGGRFAGAGIANDTVVVQRLTRMGRLGKDTYSLTMYVKHHSLHSSLPAERS